MILYGYKWFIVYDTEPLDNLPSSQCYITRLNILILYFNISSEIFYYCNLYLSRLLDLGFEAKVAHIIESIDQQAAARQTVLLSATLTEGQWIVLYFFLNHVLTYYFYMAPFQEERTYCFAHVGPSLGRSGTCSFLINGRLPIYRVVLWNYLPYFTHPLSG